MVQLQTHNNSGRKKLVITKALEKRMIRDKYEVLEFMAKVEGEDATVKYGVWANALYEFIKPDTTIDCDVAVKEQEQKDQDGNLYHNRKVLKIYVNGKPIGGQQQKTWGKSPETVAMELDSKARNTALMQAIETAKRLSVGGNAKEEAKQVTALADYYYAWLKGEKPTEKPSVAPQATGKATEQKSKGVAPVEDKQPEKAKRYKDGAAVVNAAQKIKHMSLEAIYRDLKIEKPSDITDPEAAAKVLGI